MKNLRSKKTLLLSGALLMFVTGCTKVTDGSGKVLPAKIIQLSTTLNGILKSESWFSAFFVYPLAQAINFLAPIIGVGLAIGAVTIIIKLLTLTFTVKSTVASQKMNVIQPELKKIQDKYADRKDDASKMAMGQEMQNLYAKNNINPFGTILITFIQLPIILAMYQAVQRSSAVVNGTIMGASLQVSPLTGMKNGTIIYFVIYILMGVFQFLSLKMPTWLGERSQKKTAKHHDEPKKKASNSMNTMMYSSLVLIMFLSISWPTAMSLYWLVSAVAQVAQTLYIQWKYIDKAEGAK